MRRDRSPSEAAKPIHALVGHQNRKSVFPEFSEALGGPVVEADVASIVRSGEAPVKEAPRSWSPNSPYFNAERHELNVVKAFSGTGRDGAHLHYQWGELPKPTG